MRSRTVASVIAVVLVTLVWLALLVQPAAAFCVSAAPQEDVLRPNLPASGLPLRGGVFRPSLLVDGKLAPGALGLPGEQVTWVITLANTGTAPGTDVIVTDQVHDELRIDSVEVDRGDFAISGQVVVFNTPIVQPGEQIQMRINTTVLRTPPGGTLGNRAEVSAQGPGGAVEDVALTEVYVPTGLPETGYPPAEDLPGAGEPSVLFFVVAAVAVVALAAGFVWWRGSAPPRLG